MENQTPQIGELGPIYTQFKDKPKDAIKGQQKTWLLSVFDLRKKSPK
jgi:hypothetical protein